MNDRDADSGELGQLIFEYIGRGRVMQLATCLAGQPWICSVYYVADGTGALYWLSFPTRRHSREIMQHANVAAAIAVQSGHSKPVIGLQVEGEAAEVTDEEVVKKIMAEYVARYNQGADFYERFVNGTNQHHMYFLTPRRYMLFDEERFGDGHSREWLPPTA